MFCSELDYFTVNINLTLLGYVMLRRCLQLNISRLCFVFANIFKVLRGFPISLGIEFPKRTQSCEETWWEEGP